MSLIDDPTSKPRIVRFVPLVTGETWRGLKSLKIVRHSLPPATALVGVRIQWREYLAAPEKEEQSIANGRIEALDLTEWKVKIKEMETAGWKPADWIGDVQTEDADGILEIFVRLMLPIRAGTNRDA